MQSDFKLLLKPATLPHSPSHTSILPPASPCSSNFPSAALRKPLILRNPRLSPFAHSMQNVKTAARRLPALKHNTPNAAQPRLGLLLSLARASTKISNTPKRQPPHPASQRRCHPSRSHTQLCYPSAHDASQPSLAANTRQLQMQIKAKHALKSSPNH